jgi:hypothetical protein
MVQDIGLTACAGGTLFIKPAKTRVRFVSLNKAALPLFLFSLY